MKKVGNRSEKQLQHTNPFLKQQKHKDIISFSDKMTVINLLHQLDTENIIEGIIKEEN